MTWKVFEYDQEETIRGSAALSKYGSGACLALAMRWCASKKRNISSLHYKGLVATEAQKTDIANMMENVQESVLADLFSGGKFKYHSNGTPIDSIDNTKGKINNLQAYAHRLEKMSAWGRSEGLALLDDRVGFPAGQGGWIPGMIDAALPQNADRTMGLICLTGPVEGHAFGYEHKRDPHQVVNLFDPNFGEYRSTSAAEFRTWFTTHLNTEYSDLNQHWWVIKFR